MARYVPFSLRAHPAFPSGSAARAIAGPSAFELLSRLAAEQLVG
jgi:hypothetical protein